MVGVKILDSKLLSVIQMVTLEIDTEKPNHDINLEIRQMKTQQLMKLYEHLYNESSLFVQVSDELSWRARHERQLEHEKQINDIKALFHSME